VGSIVIVGIISGVTIGSVRVGVISIVGSAVGKTVGVSVKSIVGVRSGIIVGIEVGISVGVASWAYATETNPKGNNEFIKSERNVKLESIFRPKLLFMCTPTNFVGIVFPYNTTQHEIINQLIK
jgi:hypothetical protein